MEKHKKEYDGKQQTLFIPVYMHEHNKILSNEWGMHSWYNEILNVKIGYFSFSSVPKMYGLVAMATIKYPRFPFDLWKITY